MELDVRELNLHDYIEILFRRKWIVLLIFSIVFLSFVAYTNFQPKIYKASLVFKVKILESTKPLAYLSSEKRGAKEITRETIEDYIRMITSTTVVEAALRQRGRLSNELGLDQRIEMIEEYQRTISAEQVPKTNMIQLEVFSEERRFAANFANTLFNALKKISFSEKNQQRREVTVFIQKAFDDVQEKLRKEDERLRILTTQGVVGTAESLQKQITDLERKRMQLLSTYTKKYPEVMALTDQMEELRAELRTLPPEEFEYVNLKRDTAIDQDLYNSLKKKLQEARIAEAERIDNVILVEKAVTPKRAHSPKKLLNYITGIICGFFLAITGAFFLEQVMETSIGRVEDIEALIKVSIIGLIPMFAGEIDRTRSKWKTIFRPTKESPISKLRKTLILHHSKGSIFLESFRILGANVQVLFGVGGRIKNKIIMVTGSNPAEGKSLISSNLSIILAQMGYNTLLLDTDVRKPAINKLFGLKEKTVGLTDILLGKYPLEEIGKSVVKNATDLMLGDLGAAKVLESPWVNNLHILTAGTVTPNPVHLFNSAKLSETMEFLKMKYDVIIVDSAPILVVSDPAILAPKMDGVLLVYRVGTTSRITLRRAKARIENIRGKDAVNGLILNNVVPKFSMESYAAYYHKDFPIDNVEKKAG